MDNKITLIKLDEFSLTSRHLVTDEITFHPVRGDAFLIVHDEFKGLVLHQRQKGIDLWDGAPPEWLVTESVSGFSAGRGETFFKAIESALSRCEEEGVYAYHEKRKQRAAEVGQPSPNVLPEV